MAPSKVLRLLLAPLADLEAVLGFFFIDRLAYGLSEALLAATNRCGDLVALQFPGLSGTHFGDAQIKPPAPSFDGIGPRQRAHHRAWSRLHGW